MKIKLSKIIFALIILFLLSSCQAMPTVALPPPTAAATPSVSPATSTAILPTSAPEITALATKTDISKTKLCSQSIALETQPLTRTGDQPTASSLILTLVQTDVVRDEETTPFYSLNVPGYSSPLFDTFYGSVALGEGIMQTIDALPPQPSPNGTALLLPAIGDLDDPRTGGLWVAEWGTGKLRRLLPKTPPATWLPNGREIAYIEGNTLCTLAIDEGAAPTARFTHPDLFGLFSRPSPDGRWIAVVTTAVQKTEGSDELTDTFWLIPTDGSAPRELASRPGFAIARSPDELSWSADSQLLLVRGINQAFDLNGVQVSAPLPGAAYWLPNRNVLLVNGENGMAVMSLAGEELARITDTYTQVWDFSHEGDRVAYAQAAADGTEVIVYSFDDGMREIIGMLPTAEDPLSRLRWRGDDGALIGDDGVVETPVWMIEARAGGVVTPILENALLIGVIESP